jgi:AraC-like DNA-binding protein
VRTAALTGYAGLATSMGLDPAELMVQVGLSIGDLETPDRWVPAASVARLLELSATEADCADLGLRLASLRGLGTLGPLSMVLRDEPDLRRVIALLSRYERAYNEALHLRLDESGDLATLEVWLEFGEPLRDGQSVDLTMAAVMGIIRTLVGRDWEPLTTCFAHPAPADPAPYNRLFGSLVRFDEPMTSLVFPVAQLDAPVVTSDPSIRPYSRQLLHTVVPDRAPTTAEQVADVVDLLLPLGRCSLAAVSRQLGVRSRELQRSLADEGESFSSVVNAVRARQAEHHLRNGRHSLTDVSHLLGFGAPSGFSRWFRQQFGTSATDWRRRVDRPVDLSGGSGDETDRGG